jgi:hypothetical protein
MATLGAAAASLARPGEVLIIVAYRVCRARKGETPMMRLRRILPAIFVLISVAAFADNISLTNLSASMTIIPNSGSGDNLGGNLFGPGINLGFNGGTVDWFSYQGFAPGSAGGGSTFIVAGGGGETILVGSQPYYIETFAGAPFNIGAFTFPTNGQNFTTTVAASLGLFNGLGCTPAGVCPTFTFATKPGQLTLSFNYGDGLYYFNAGSFSTVPEPGTLGLMAIGLGTLGWLSYKQKWASGQAL